MAEHILGRLARLFNACGEFVVEWEEQGTQMPCERLVEHVRKVRELAVDVKIKAVREMYARLREET